MPETDETLDCVDLLVPGGGMASAPAFGVTAARTATRQVLAS